MKKFYKSLIPFFCASLFKNPFSSLAKNITEPKEIFIGTKLEKTGHVQDQLKLAFEKKKNTLNKKKVFLLVKNTNNKEKFEKNVLLLLGSQDYLNARQSNYKDRQSICFNKLLYPNTDSTMQKKTVYTETFDGRMVDMTNLYKNNFDRVLGAVYRQQQGLSALNPQENTFFKYSLRGGKSYFVGSEGGYKSICPVFFDENSAKDFLLESTEKNFEEQIGLKNMQDCLKVKKKNFKTPSMSSKKTDRNYSLPKLTNNMQDIKVICLGLGDFIEYYSTVPNKEALEKVEFFFIPKLDSINTKTKIPYFPVNRNKRNPLLYQFKVKTDQRKLKGFKSYQRQLYEVKRQADQELLNQTRELANYKK